MGLILDPNKIWTTYSFGHVMDDNFLNEVLKRREPCVSIKILIIQSY